MKPTAHRYLAANAEADSLNQRALAKLRTRGKILASASNQFAAKGYDGATMRDIAAAAGVSTGALFNNFVDKFDLFSEIVEADRHTLLKVMRAAAVGDTAEETLLAVFEAGYRHALENLPLLQATISASWSPELGAKVRNLLNRWPVGDVVGGVLYVAVERGELKQGTNVTLMAQMLSDCFLANFRHAAFENWRLRDLRARLKEQSSFVLASAMRPGARTLENRRRAL